MNGHTLDDINGIFGAAGHDDVFDDFPSGPFHTNSNPLEPDDDEVERQARFRVDQEDAERNGNGHKRPTKPKTTPCNELLTAYLDRLRRGEADKLWKLDEHLDGMEVGPGLIATLAAPPAVGKTALASQILFGALEHNPELTATIANAEMHFDVVARRELSKRSGVRQKDIRFGNLTFYDWEKLEAAQRELEPLLTRCSWLEAPHTYDQLKSLQEVTPGLLVLDYLQKFVPTDVEARIGANAVMALLRHLALDGWGILALSATTRTRGKGGSSHDSMQLTMASMKESGEIEFNADSVYLLRDNGPIEDKQWLRQILLDCVKNRHDETSARPLEFSRPKMQFRILSPAAEDVQEHDFGEYEGNPFEELSP